MSRILGAVQLIRILITETCNLVRLLWYVTVMMLLSKISYRGKWKKISSGSKSRVQAKYY